MLCGASGIIYKSVIYQGSTTIPTNFQDKYSATNGLVMYLAERIPEGKGHKLFCDNYFTSLVILEELLKKRIFVAGTIRNNRLEKCPLKSENELKKIGRGSSHSVTTKGGELVAVRWYDNKAVSMCSNFVGVEPEDEVRRWDKKEKKYIFIKRPAIVRYYNISMGGVDKSDFLIALYRTFIRSKKWTLRVIFHYFNLGVINAWLEYQRDMKNSGMKKKKWIYLNSRQALLKLWHFLVLLVLQNVVDLCLTVAILRYQQNDKNQTKGQCKILDMIPWATGQSTKMDMNSDANWNSAKVAPE